MTTYILMVKILGGDWKRFQLGGKDYETEDLASAFAMRATVQDAIREVMVVAITPQWQSTEDSLVIVKKYELVE